MQTRAQERRDPEATLPLRQGERLLKLPGWKRLPRAGELQPGPPPSDLPSSPTQAGATMREEGLSGRVHSDWV